MFSFVIGRSFDHIFEFQIRTHCLLFIWPLDLNHPQRWSAVMAVGRGFFDQYSVFCVFGSVVGCVVVPLITQVTEHMIILITLTGTPSGLPDAKVPMIIPSWSNLSLARIIFVKIASTFNLQSVESVIFSAIVISLTATHLTKRATKSENSNQVSLNTFALILALLNLSQIWSMLCRS